MLMLSIIIIMPLIPQLSCHQTGHLLLSHRLPPALQELNDAVSLVFLLGLQEAAAAVLLQMEASVAAAAAELVAAVV